MSTASPSTQSTAVPTNINTPNPNAPPFRPSPARAVSLQGTSYQHKGRAASQPAGERLPPPSSTPNSGRGSPGINGNGGAFGVIGGSRTPGRFGSALTGSGGSGMGTATRASSFSAGELRDPRFVPSRSHSTSPFPTFSPNSTPSTSPAALRQHPLPSYSPPKASANVSRSRSQSLATGVRPIGVDRPFMVPMSTLENNGNFPKSLEAGWNISPPEASNMSPFTRGLPSLGGNPARDELYSRNGSNQTAQDRFRVAQDPFHGARAAWIASAPDSATTALTSSVAKALGAGYAQHPLSGVAYGESNTGGNRSGTSSRRHSVSVVGGPGGRREFTFGESGMGITPMASPPGRGLFGFEGDLSNALSLDIAEGRRRGVEQEKEPFHPASLPKFDPTLAERYDGHQRVGSYPRAKAEPFGEPTFPSFVSSSPRGRLDQGPGAPGERAPSGESKDGSQRSRFAIENAAVGSPVRLGAGRLNGSGGVTGSPDKGREIGFGGPVGTGVPRGLGPGPIGSPPTAFSNLPSQNFQPQGPFPGMRPPQFQSNIGPGPHLGGQPPFGRPPAPGYGAFYGGNAPNSRPPPGPGPGSPFGAPQPAFGNGTFGNASGQAYGSQPGPPGPNQGYPQYFPAPGSPQQPTSPSFSSLSLADLGKGISLISLPPTTPLYIVTFKAGRRDVYYCPDPTLLISNGDKVIVEADRGSDLGTVVYDQLTPMDVREWQEKQATAALLSGASQHQPPGMAAMGNGSGGPGPMLHKKLGSMAGGGVSELANMDLDGLLAGVGPSGQMELSGTAVRGPLAKEVMPKRIFAKSSQGPEEQARMREKAHDEYEAMMICKEKVIQRGLPMQIVDAEYQWDRRKLTFYFKADKRVDFRDLTKENFRIFKSRIWMSMVPKDGK
ncbi:hypothetical protein CI109_103494 [Kwoniella shandongensis]|uniref:PSP1 C-terminal domain-containing protein n=1 Tax=Kwoniella shandongensis TaxID=1734106 RepID=A0AAJ8LIA1_9TREE